MLEIKKGNPWIFWPSSICDSLPEIPADKFLNGKHSYQYFQNILDWILMMVV